MPRLRLVLACAVLAAAAPPSAAGQRSESVDARMTAFVRALHRHPPDSLAAFFPRQGTWTWVKTTRYGGRADVVGRWVFRGADLPEAAEPGGPLCHSLSFGGDVMLPSALIHAGGDEGRPWRRVSRTRFVPAGAPASSRVHVDWRREDGRWVVAALGEERTGRPRLLGVPRTMVTRLPRTPFPMTSDEGFADRAPWFVEGRLLHFAGRLLEKYGLPRPIETELLDRVGVIDGIPVYAETGVPGIPEVVYLPVAAGGFQPYQAMIGDGCQVVTPVVPPEP